MLCLQPAQQHCSMHEERRATLHFAHNKQVAAELGVSFKTVNKHRQNLMTKLDIHDVAGLTRYAIAEGIIESTVRLTIF